MAIRKRIMIFFLLINFLFLRVSVADSSPTIIDGIISEYYEDSPKEKTTFSWNEVIKIWFKISNPLSTEIDVHIQGQIIDPITKSISGPNKIITLKPGIHWYNFKAKTPRHAGKGDVTWILYSLNYETQIGEIKKEKYLNIQEGELPEEPSIIKPTTLRVIPSNITIQTGMSSRLFARLTADSVGELIYHDITWSVKQGALEFSRTKSGQDNLYTAPNYETTELVTVTFPGSDGYKPSQHIVIIEVKKSVNVIDNDVEWWFETQSDQPQFLITVFNDGEHGFTISKVVLSGIKVWEDSYYIKPHSKGELPISNIEKVFERGILNNLNEVYIENAVKNPCFYGNLVIINKHTAYESGHSTVSHWMKLLGPELTPEQEMLARTPSWVDENLYVTYEVSWSSPNPTNLPWKNETHESKWIITSYNESEICFSTSHDAMGWEMNDTIYSTYDNPQFGSFLYPQFLNELVTATILNQGNSVYTYLDQETVMIKNTPVSTYKILHEMYMEPDAPEPFWVIFGWYEINTGIRIQGNSSMVGLPNSPLNGLKTESIMIDTNIINLENIDENPSQQPNDGIPGFPYPAMMLGLIMVILLLDRARLQIK